MGTQPVARSRLLGRRAGRRDPAEPSGLIDALFATTRQRVLGLIFGQPSRSFFARELIGLTRSGSGAVQRELERLASSGLVTTTRIGNQKHFQANRGSPIFAELHGLMLKTIALAEPLKQALGPLADRTALALVYGSVVKGTDTVRSDVDVLIVADDVMLEEVYSTLAPVEADLGRKINPTLYTRKEFASRRASKNAFLVRVLSGEHLVLMGGEDESSAARQPRKSRQAQGRTLRAR